MLFTPRSTSCKTRSSTNSSSSGSIRRCSSSSPAILGGSRLSTRTCHLLPETVLGLSSPLILLVIGALLLLYAASLFVAAARRAIDRQTGFLYATIDGAWVLGSVVLAAFVVSAFAGLQSYGAWRAR